MLEPFAKGFIDAASSYISEYFASCIMLPFLFGGSGMKSIRVFNTVDSHSMYSQVSNLSVSFTVVNIIFNMNCLENYPHYNDTLDKLLRL